MRLKAKFRLKRPQKAKFRKNINFFKLINVTQAAQMELAGHMPPSGRVFDPPVLKRFLNN